MFRSCRLNAVASWYSNQPVNIDLSWQNSSAADGLKVPKPVRPLRVDMDLKNKYP